MTVTAPDISWKDPDYAGIYQARLERIRRIREPDFDMSALREFYKTHPVEFIMDWGMTVDPRNADLGKPTTVPFLLFQKQIDYVMWVHGLWVGRKDGVCEKSRDMGVSWLCVAFAVWMWIFIDGAAIGFGSRKEDYVDKIGDPKSLFWKIRAFIRLLPPEFRPGGYSERVHAPFMRVINPVNGATITGEAGDGIGRGARCSIYFVDEAAFLERADGVDSALSNTANCKIWLSTVNGTGNVFHRKRTSGRYSVFVFDWRDDPRKGPEWYAEFCANNEPHVVAQEVDRDYTAAVTDSYIDGKIVTAATMRGPADVVAVGPLQVGVDCARFGNDKTVVTFRRGRLCSRQEWWGRADTVDSAGRVKDLVNAAPDLVEQIAVDTIGIGAGVADMLRRDFGARVVDVNSGIVLDDGVNYNLRARMWRDMREWLKGPVSIPNSSDLATDLTSLRYSYKMQRLLIESKVEAKKRGIKSPDFSDSLALTFAYPVEKIDNSVDPALNPAWEAISEVVGY